MKKIDLQTLNNKQMNKIRAGANPCCCCSCKCTTNDEQLKTIYDADVKQVRATNAGSGGGGAS